MDFFKQMSITILVIVSILIIIILVFFFKRETKEWKENIKTLTGQELMVDFMSSERGYFGSHGLGWGGGYEKRYIKFEYDGVDYECIAPYTPISIQYDNLFFYIIYFDRETDFEKITFRFFKSTNKGVFEEIKAIEFPKGLAVQNRWFDDAKEQKETEQLSLDKMQRSLTSKLWYRLEKGIYYYEMPAYIPLEFLESYKDNYLK